MTASVSGQCGTNIWGSLVIWTPGQQTGGTRWNLSDCCLNTGSPWRCDGSFPTIGFRRSGSLGLVVMVSLWASSTMWWDQRAASQSAESVSPLSMSCPGWRWPPGICQCTSTSVCMVTTAPPNPRVQELPRAWSFRKQSGPPSTVNYPLCLSLQTVQMLKLTVFIFHSYYFW